MTIPLSGAQAHLVAGDYTADIASVGATLRSLRFGDRPLVATFDEDAVRPYYFGATLVPWPNRIVDGRYLFDGVEQQVALTEPERGQALHGLAAWLDYDIAAQSADSVTLTATVPPQKGYPHRIAVRMTYSLSAEGLLGTLTAENTGPTRAPFGTAPHPYLVAGAGTADDWTLTLPADSILTADERLSPLELVPVSSDNDFRKPRLLGATKLDHAFTGLSRDEDGQARVVLLAADDHGVSMSWGAEYSWAQVFTGDIPVPEYARHAVAVEPMTCPPDAFNTGRDLLVLEPGESFTGSWRIRAE